MAAKRLHQGFLQAGHTSRFMVGNTAFELPEISLVPRDWRTRWLHRLLPLTGLNYLEYIGSFKIPETAFYREANVINFHNLHRDYFSYLALPALTSEKPAVWTLHDMWSFTGHCAYSFNCHRWKSGCGKCPYLKEYPEVRRDATRWEWKLKDKAYSRSRINIVVPSRWLENLAKKSVLSRHFPVDRIPHGIDTDTFQPMEKNLCRQVLGIAVSRTVLLFAAMSASDYRKGGDLLLKALQPLPKSLKSNILLIVMGEGGEAYQGMTDIDVYPAGYFEGDQLKTILYNAADLFLFPTRADIWSLVVQEAMACGIPSISFDIGGVSDLVRPEITGLLATPEDIDSFREAVTELIEDSTKRQQMSSNCRTIAVEEYRLELQTSRYLSIYRKMLNAV